MTPDRSAAFKAGERVGAVTGLLICAVLTGLLAAAAVLAIFQAFQKGGPSWP